MPRAYGSDRVEMLSEGSAAVIDAYHHKGWRGRRPADQLRSEHPGTAIQWDNQLWEVVTAEPTNHGVRYYLERWKPSHVVRHCEAYDDKSERARRMELADVNRRERRRRAGIAASILLGHLPAEAQDYLHLEYGLPPSLPTIISVIPTAIIGVTSVIFLMVGGLGFPTSLLLYGVYLFGESCLRFSYSFATGKPMGSLVGCLIFAIGEAFTSRGKREQVLRLDVSDDIVQQDRYYLRQPLLSLLPIEDQKRLQKRYGFDPIEWGKKTSAVLLALVGMAVTIQLMQFSDGKGDAARTVAFFINLYFLAEQLVRLGRAFAGLPSASLLGYLVRPLTRCL
jgi:hypothetical protein